jgi:hypothetical protein
MGSSCVPHAGLKLPVLLPHPPDYWGYRCVPSRLAFRAFSTYGELMGLLAYNPIVSQAAFVADCAQ